MNCCAASRRRCVLINGVPAPAPSDGDGDPGETGTRVLAEDRETAASDVLERLAG